MKNEEEVQSAADRLKRGRPTAYVGMSYEDGIREALEWVLGNSEDSDFFDGKVFNAAD